MTRIAFALVAAALAAAPLAAAESIDEALDAKAGGVLRKLKDKGYATVGVLRFVRPTPDGDRDDLGEFGLSLACRTKAALSLANRDDGFTVLDDPHHQAKKEYLKEASPLTVEGRKAFFDIKYTPTFGKPKVAADAFIAGTALPSKDLKTVTVKLRVCGPDGELTDLSDEWVVDADPAVLGELGKSYALPPIQVKALVTGEPVKPEVVRAAAAETQKVVAGPAEPKKPGRPAPRRANPALDASPVQWEVRYGDEKQEVDGDRLPEPAEKVDVTFVLTNPSADETYAVVLLVNGENTLYQERQAVAKCRKWVLEPRTKTVISGFQMGKQEAVKFTVVPPDDKLADGVRDSADLGLFRMVVFAGKLGTKPGEKTDRQIPAAEVIASTRLNDSAGERPRTREAYQALLVRQTGDLANSRGVLVKGTEVVSSKTEAVEFVPASDQPVADITLRYYHPAK
jgi:hypothetical protein